MRLRANTIGNNGIKAVARALQRCPLLKTLNLYTNQIGDDGCKELATAMAMLPALQGVDLGNNQISNSGVILLTTAIPKCRALKKLSLYGNNVGDAGVDALIAAVRDPQSPRGLTSISVARNRDVSAAAKTRLENALPKEHASARKPAKGKQSGNGAPSTVKPEQRACPACTFLNDTAAVSCAMCSSSLESTSDGGGGGGRSSTSRNGGGRSSGSVGGGGGGSSNTDTHVWMWWGGGKRNGYSPTTSSQLEAAYNAGEATCILHMPKGRTPKNGRDKRSTAEYNVTFGVGGGDHIQRRVSSGNGRRIFRVPR